MNLRWLAPVLVVLAASAGCVRVGAGSDGKPLGKYAYEGPECDEVRLTGEESTNMSQSKRHGKRHEEVTLREQALVVVCPVVEFAYSNYTGSNIHGEKRHLVSGPDLHKIHAEYDDRYPDMVRAALFVIGAASGHGTEERDSWRVHSYDPVPLEPQKDDEATHVDMITGLAAMYAGWVDTAELGKDLDTIKFPRAAAGTMVTLFQQAKGEIDRRVARMPKGKRDIFVQIPIDTVRARNAYYRKHAAAYGALDKQSKDPEAILKLRSEYVTTCGGGEDCTFEPFYVEATRELALHYVGARAPAHAMAESSLLRRKGVEKTGLAQALYAAQHEAGMRAHEAYETRNRVKSKGMDDKLAAAVNQGVAPIRFRYGALWQANERFANYAEVLKTEKVHKDSGFVLAVKKNGEKAVVEFKTEYDVVEDPVNCVKTNRIESISSDGHLNYEEVCQYVPRRVARPKPEPITVDARDVAKVQPGELLTILIEPGESRTGVVVDAHKQSDKESLVVQLRGDRVTPRPKPAKK